MDDRDLLREIEAYAQALSEAADHGPTHHRATSVGVIGAQTRAPGHLRRSLVTVIVVAAVLATSATAVLVAVNRSPKSHPGPHTSNAAPSGASGPTAAQLIAGTWSLMPAAPISGNRQGASVVWTGHELIVWGGWQVHGTRRYTDGAAYDPAAHTWRKLPPSPLSARVGQASVWTGTQLVIWGGEVGPALTPTADGAAYSPATNSWRMLPGAPLTPRADAIAVWTGSRVMLFGGFSIHTADLDGATYDFASRTWRHFDAPTPPDHHPLSWSLAVAIGGERVLAWSLWSEAPTRKGEFPPGGADLFSFDPRTNSWTSEPATAGALQGPVAAIRTGQALLVLGGPPPCDLCSRPGFGAQYVARYDPGPKVWTQYRNLLSGDAAPLSTWTGQALFASISGLTEIFDPASDTWTELRAAPVSCRSDSPPAWTGTQVIAYCPDLPPTSRRTFSGVVFTPAPNAPAPATNPVTQAALAGYWRPVAASESVGPLTAPPLIEPPLLHFDGAGRVTGSDGCYPVSASYRLRDGNAIEFKVVNGVQYSCSAVPESLRTAASVAIRDGRLVLFDDHRHEIAEYQRVSARSQLPQSKLQFRQVHMTQPKAARATCPRLAPTSPTDPGPLVTLPDPSGTTCYAVGPAFLTGGAIAGASAKYDPKLSAWTVDTRWTGNSLVQKLSQPFALTEIAVVLHGQVRSVVTFRPGFTGHHLELREPDRAAAVALAATIMGIAPAEATAPGK